VSTGVAIRIESVLCFEGDPTGQGLPDVPGSRVLKRYSMAGEATSVSIMRSIAPNRERAQV
jgi:hypothetical protein